MAESPHVYGERIYEIEKMGDAHVVSVQMDVGRNKGNGWREVRSAEEYHDLIWKTRGEEVFACIFDLIVRTGTEAAREGFPATVKLDFISKRLTLQVDPSMGADDKKQLADFYEMLTDEDYYLERIIDEAGEELAGIKRLSLVGKAAVAALFVILIAGAILSGNDPDAGPDLFTILLGALPLIISIGDGIHQYLLKRAAQKKLDELSMKTDPDSEGKKSERIRGEKDREL